jgi:hypothetical protein
MARLATLRKGANQHNEMICAASKLPFRYLPACLDQWLLRRVLINAQMSDPFSIPILAELSAAAPKLNRRRLANCFFTLPRTGRTNARRFLNAPNLLASEL